MKQIQWFPGHMTKATRQLKEKIDLVDIIFELVDARIPYSSSNPHLKEATNKKPRIILLNKMDKADDKATNQWISYFKSQGYYTLKIDSSLGINLDKIGPLAKEVLKAKIEKDAKKGLKERRIRAMIIGIPNVGKSTIINKISKRKVAETGDRPGVTKAQQWIRLDDFELLDTPGVLWPKFEEEATAFNLAITGAIKDDILPLDDICIHAMKYIYENYPGLLEERYNLKNVDFDDIEQIYIDIGRRRGCLIRGNQVDYDQVSRLVLKDIRDGYLGKLSFETPKNRFNCTDI